MSYNYDEGETSDILNAVQNYIKNNPVPVQQFTGPQPGTWEYELMQGNSQVGPYAPTPSEVGLNAGGSSGSNSNGSGSSTVVVKSPVKIATPQYVDFNEAKLNPITTNEILNLYFEEINGHALLLLNNTNFVNTPSINYQPIVNMWEIAKRYDPKKILGLQDTADTYFGNFSIKLENKIPKVPSNESTNGTNVYLATSQDLILTAVVVGYNRSARLVIETVNMEKDERVEIEILSDGTIDTDLIEEYVS